MGPVIEVANVGDRRELLDMLAAAFRDFSPTHPEFDAIYPDLFVPTEEAMARHRIVRQDGRIIACVGCYPQTLRLGPVTVEMFGIGQVSCLKAWRERGYMTALLKETIARMEATAAAMSWLGGRRDRYATFGWEVAGTTARCRLTRKTLARGADPLRATFDIASLGPADVTDDLWRLVSSGPVRCVYPREEWLVKLTRGKPQTIWTATPPGASAPVAFAVAPEGADGLTEYGGQPHALRALLAAVAQRNGHGAVSLSCCPGLTEDAEFYWTHAEWVSPELLNLRVHHLDRLMEAYRPLWDPLVPTGESATLVMRREGPGGETRQRFTLGQRPAGPGDELCLDELQMVRLLFGPWSPTTVLPLPPRLRWLNQVFPLPFTVPIPAHV